MAEFNSNRWYWIPVGDQTLGLVARPNGPVYSGPFNTQDFSYQWQIINNGSYTLMRNRFAGPRWFLSSQFDSNEETPGSTAPVTLVGIQPDGTSFWQWRTWPDGTFFLSNAANGTGVRLFIKGNGQSAMTTNTTFDAKSRKVFVFSSMALIDDDTWSMSKTSTSTSSLPTLSTVATTSADSSITSSQPSTTDSIATSTPTSTSTATSPSSNIQTASTGLSTTAIVGISAGVGGAALLALLIFAMYQFIRHRQVKRTSGSNPTKFNRPRTCHHDRDASIDKKMKTTTNISSTPSELAALTPDLRPGSFTHGSRNNSRDGRRNEAWEME